ncbi:MAG: sulfate reduction electron transfer complex DsrMKJOP subunit DsrO [Pseudomonadota bacterium]
MDDKGRRRFLKIAGCTALGLGSAPLWSAVAGGWPRGTKNPQALKGGRWAMVIDLKKCQEQQGCTDCIETCHRIHNVPHFDDPNREVKWIWKEDFNGAFPDQGQDFLESGVNQKPALITCNHCDRAPCVRVCPTKATWRREDGVVMMDMHRCIGCRYCMVACPYGARSFNWSDPRKALKSQDKGFPTRMKGVVEKCNFCAERLAKGQLPGCVEVCKYGAMSFGDLQDPNSEVRRILRSSFAIRRKIGLGTQPSVFYLV